MKKKKSCKNCKFFKEFSNKSIGRFKMCDHYPDPDLDWDDEYCHWWEKDDEETIG